MAYLEVANNQVLDHNAAFVGGGGHDMPSAFEKLTHEQRARLGSVVRLLETAGQTLLGADGEEAYRCVAKATALLQAECEFGVGEDEATQRHDFLPPWKMARVVSFIEGNLDRPIRVSEMASVARLSCSHFSRAFRSTAKETPSVFVARRRMEQAERMIVMTDKPLSQVALDCGLADQSHLTKLFRRAYGVSPGKWRRLQQGVERHVVVTASGLSQREPSLALC